MAELVLGHMEKEGVEVMRGCVPCSLTCGSADSDIAVSFKMLKDDQHHFQEVSAFSGRGWGEDLVCSKCVVCNLEEPIQLLPKKLRHSLLLKKSHSPL